jgi:secreted trypsin-like serine protease
MSRRLTAGLVAAAAVSLAATSLASPASAVPGGSPDGSGHPNVGGLVADHAYSDGTWTYCSGTLVAPKVFLTAAHCGEGGDGKVRVTFDPAYEQGDRTFAGTFHADPRYGHRQSDPHDIAVVVLESPVSITPARLPAAGSLSRLRHGQPFTSVGYGAYQVTQGPGGHQYLYDDVRRVAHGSLNAVTTSWLRLSMNPATGDGGTCYGDSGGPNFLGSSTTVAAITISGDAQCRATNVDYRLDTASARSFLDDYVAVP